MLFPVYLVEIVRLFLHVQLKTRDVFDKILTYTWSNISPHSAAVLSEQISGIRRAVSMIRLAALPNLDGLVHTAGDHVRVASVHVCRGNHNINNKYYDINRNHNHNSLVHIGNTVRTNQAFPKSITAQGWVGSVYRVNYR